MLNKWFKISIFVCFSIFLLGFSVFYLTKSSYNLDFNAKRLSYNEKDFIDFLEKEVKTEKMYLKFTNKKNYYFIDYYVQPVFFIPFKKIKIDKEFIDVLFKNDKENYVLYIRYECLSLLSFNNQKPKNRKVNEYFEFEIINYKNININFEEIEKRCL